MMALKDFREKYNLPELLTMDWYRTIREEISQGMPWLMLTSYQKELLNLAYDVALLDRYLNDFKTHKGEQSKLPGHNYPVYFVVLKEFQAGIEKVNNYLAAWG